MAKTKPLTRRSPRPAHPPASLPSEPAVLLDVHQAARLLGITSYWLYEQTRRKGDSQVPHLRVGKRVRFRRTELESWLDRLAVGGQTKAS